MRITVVAVGRLRSKACASLCADYLERLGRYLPARVEEVRDVRGQDPERCKEQEGERLLAALPPGARAVLLDERGETLTSEDLAARLDAWTRDGTRDLRFVVGGPFGVSDAVRARCEGSLRLSSFTLPHELARLVLVEQLYRAWTILRGTPYHHA